LMRPNFKWAQWRMASCFFFVEQSRTIDSLLIPRLKEMCAPPCLMILHLFVVVQD
jgi:hypothetical protein